MSGGIAGIGFYGNGENQLRKEVKIHLKDRSRFIHNE
jgi:hypothetical protein